MHHLKRTISAHIRLPILLVINFLIPTYFDTTQRVYLYNITALL